MPHPQYQRPADWELRDLAEAVARVAHSGQTRSGGEPYINHAQRVADSAWESGDNWTAATIAWLHDTIEDTTVTRSALRDIGFPREIVDAVTLLTRSPDESYEHYVDRLIEFASDDALVVKLADLADNLHDLEQSTFSEQKKRTLRERYGVALERILGEQNRREAISQVRTWQFDRVLDEAA